MEDKMEKRSFQLNESVLVSDERGEVGRGVVIGRTFASPMRYDVKIDDEIYNFLPEYELSHV